MSSVIGTIVRLQVQRSSVKVGEGRARRFDPTPILAVDSLLVTRRGVTAEHDGAVLIDVHHADHPRSKNRDLINGISVGFTSHYDRMRERFGGHLTNGIAGENVLVETDTVIDLADIEGGLVIEGDDGRRVALGSVVVAHPCVEFSRFALDDLDAPARVVSEVLKFMDNGVRGYYALPATDEPVRISIGDRVRLASG